MNAALVDYRRRNEESVLDKVFLPELRICHFPVGRKGAEGVDAARRGMHAVAVCVMIVMVTVGRMLLSRGGGGLLVAEQRRHAETIGVVVARSERFSQFLK